MEILLLSHNSDFVCSRIFFLARMIVASIVHSFGKHSVRLNILVIVVFFAPLLGWGRIQVTSVDFDKVGREEWIRSRMEIRVSGSSLAKKSRFLDHIGVNVYLCYGDKDSGFDYYHRRVDIVSLEIGKSYFVDCFLPGIIVKRDRLSPRPHAYFFEFEIEDKLVLYQPSFASKKIRTNEEYRMMFKAFATSVENKNRGVLYPSYLAPYSLLDNDTNRYPVYKRFGDLDG